MSKKVYDKDTEEMYDTLNVNSDEENWLMICTMLGFQAIVREESVESIVSRFSQIMGILVNRCESVKKSFEKAKSNIDIFKDMLENARDKDFKINEAIDKFKE